jgi:hypothetical protein
MQISTIPNYATLYSMFKNRNDFHLAVYDKNMRCCEETNILVNNKMKISIRNFIIKNGYNKEHYFLID